MSERRSVSWAALALAALALAIPGCVSSEAQRALDRQQLEQRNTEIALELFDALSRADKARIDELYADDFVIWTAGAMPFSGEHPRAESLQGLDLILSMFPKGITFTINEVTADGERVALEAESHGDHVSGLHYHNFYHFLVIVRDGKVHRLKEYMDTAVANEVLVESMKGKP